jgi:hypothetical protein
LANSKAREKSAGRRRTLAVGRGRSLLTGMQRVRAVQISGADPAGRD